MGQYYHALILKDKVYDTNNEQVLAWLYSHNYSNGLKLMEHSWIGNNFVETLKILFPGTIVGIQKGEGSTIGAKTFIPILL